MTIALARRGSIAALLALGGCAGGEISEGFEGDGDSQDTDGDHSPYHANVGKKARVVASIGLNLRTGPSTAYAILLTMPSGAVVDTLAGSQGWYKVNYNGRVGWCSGAWLTPVESSGGGSPNPPNPPPNNGGGNVGGGGGDADRILERGRTVQGFSYRWGGGCWNPGAAKGACYGSCPNCSHSGQWGADCSGFVAKAWQVPGPSALSTCTHPYSTYHFTNTNAHWRGVSRSSAKPADAFTYHSGGAGHIFLYTGGDAWGWMKTLECRGCSYGCGANSRTAGSGYKVIRREGL